MWRFKKRQDGSITTDLITEMRLLRESVQPAPEAVTDSVVTPGEVLERLDTLENRFEELRGTCLRHLQSASQRLKLAERKEEAMELDEDSQPLMPLASPLAPSDNGVETPLQAAARKVRASGEQAII